MWKITVANKSDLDFLITLNNTAIKEIDTQFNEVIEVFSNLRSSACSAGRVFPVGSNVATNEKLFINYHVDNDEEIIRITSVDLE